jgi:hypothetical protein
VEEIAKLHVFKQVYKRYTNILFIQILTNQRRPDRQNFSARLTDGKAILRAFIEWPGDGFVKAETCRLFEYVNKQVVLN